MKNKLKNKGFTLVELLAVIVVLSIIALIGFIQVGKVIETAKEQAAVESANNYVKAVNLKIISDMANGISVEDKTYDISDFDVDMQGTKPSNGTITIKDSKVVSGKFTISKISMKYDITNGIIVDKGSKTSYSNGTIVYFNPTTNKKCNDYVSSNSNSGNTEGCLKWYTYLETTDKVNL